MHLTRWLACYEIILRGEQGNLLYNEEEPYYCISVVPWNQFILD